MGILQSKENENEYQKVKVENENEFQEIDNNDLDLITQVVRKMCLLSEFKEYVKSSSRTSTYFKKIIGTIECTCINGIVQKEIVCSNMFVHLFTWPVENSREDTYISLLDYY